MDNFVDNKEKKKNNKHELCLFYSTITSFETLLFSKRNIRILIIIGQRNINSFSAISELIELQELWIAECGIQDVPPFKENCLLKKLYLYSNEISYIPNLEACCHLTILYLSGNNIHELENLDTLTWLQELNLANNKLERINKISWRKLELCNLNLAGNPLCFIRDIKYLSQLQKLNSLVFADSLYGDCPLVTSCNYRIYVIHYLPHIKKLDHYKISELSFIFRKQITYYNVLFHKQINMHLTLLKHKYKEYKKEMRNFKNQLYIIEMKKNDQNCLKNKIYDESQNILLQMKLNKKYLKEMGEKLVLRSKILQQQLLINMNYCGNINFVEYNTASKNTVIQLCKQFLQASLCSVTKESLGIIDLRLHKVTKVSNKEIDLLNTCTNQSLQSDECNMILKILAFPGVTDIQKWPFNFFQSDLLIEQEITVTNCLAAADCDWLNKVLLTKKNRNISTCNICEKRRVCVLVQTPIVNSVEKIDNAHDFLHIKYTNYENNSNEICQMFKLTNMSITNPMFVIEYEYILHEEGGYKNRIVTYTVDDSIFTCLSNSNIKQYINNDEKIEMYNLVKICVCGQNINSVNINLDLPNLREFDISYNQLNEFPNSCIMKNVQILNISFNNIKVLHIKESLPVLQELDISWNSLMYCFQCISTFITYVPNMYKLKIYNNPFNDVTDPELVEYLVHIYLPKLQFINNYKCEILNVPQNYFPCGFNMCKLNNKRRNKFIYLKQSILKNMEQPKLLEEKNIEQAKYIHISEDFLAASNILERVKNVHELCATYCLLSIILPTRPLKYLIKLNLGSNFISVLNDFTQENFPSLKYLDFTNNLIANLEPMGTFHTLQEFYCGNNVIKNIVQIDNVKTWQALHVIDFCNNPISTDAIHKKFIIFHLSNIEYISGEYVKNSDISEARCIFGNKFDKYVLNALYETDHLTNITQLSLVNCSLSKVDLSAELLPWLESLDLSKNQITYLWGLQSFKYLHTLCLSYNCLETFNGSDHKNNKCTFPKLYTLFLDHNCIKSLMNITKQKLPVIKYLFLNNNYLRNINGIRHCSTLKSLILDHNEIELLNVEDFIDNNNLEILSLENNKLKSLEFIQSLHKLKRLYIGDNCLTNEIEIQYLPLLKNLEEVIFEGNPIYNEINRNKIIAHDFEVKEANIEEI
ncbi:PREDICTED: leucine-rich repeat-containing protein 9-like [Eufriesea mexicana]|uniref:leucine-rich repeat-containing protein 9-like n=1 Tax=Eufriesea mexicana TaxID=516756 RepID=UPI00083BCBAB|nr:PREDICTED: leucine-rich repeat-containing protein 9-like [Eufriesea mexicana]